MPVKFSVYSLMWKVHELFRVVKYLVLQSNLSTKIDIKQALVMVFSMSIHQCPKWMKHDVSGK